MKLSKTLMGKGGIELLAEAEREERQVALEYIAEAWNRAEDDGVATQALAHASLFGRHHLAGRAPWRNGDSRSSVATLPDRIQLANTASAARCQ